MPNWYDNYLTVLGPTADRASFKEKAVGVFRFGKGSEEQVLCFNNFIPTPPSLLEPDKAEALIDWRWRNWDAKYGAINSKLRSEGEDRLSYSFESTWGPPNEFFQTIGLQWPTLTFRLSYCNADGCSWGIYSIRGEASDHCELRLDLRERDFPPLTDEEFLALGAELKPKNPLVEIEADFAFTGLFKSDHPLYKGMDFLVSHTTTRPRQPDYTGDPPESNLYTGAENPLLG